MSFVQKVWNHFIKLLLSVLYSLFDVSPCSRIPKKHYMMSVSSVAALGLNICPSLGSSLFCLCCCPQRQEVRKQRLEGNRSCMRYSAKGMHSSTFCFSNSHSFLKKMLNVNEVVKSGEKWHLESIVVSCMKTGFKILLGNA